MERKGFRRRVSEKVTRMLFDRAASVLDKFDRFEQNIERKQEERDRRNSGTTTKKEKQV